MVWTTDGDSLFLIVLYKFFGYRFLISNRTPESKKFKTEIEIEKPLQSEPPLSDLN